MQDITIAFIGGGNMARSLIGGLVSDGVPPERIRVADPGAEQRRDLSTRFGVTTDTDNIRIATGADVIVLAVKPQVMREVAASLGPAVGPDTLLVSIAAGVREVDLRAWIGGDPAIVRVMPNTPALVRSGAAALYANARARDDQRQAAESIMRAGGLTVWVEDEALLDAVTALSGSGPAYYFLVMEAMEQAGIEMGLPPDVARLLTIQTAFGAAKMALEADEGPADLRARVTSPGGTTERAITTLRGGDLEDLFRRALIAARDRARELGDLLGARQ